MNLPEDKDPAWKLLLKASKPEPGPFFARNTVREVRNLGEQRRPLFHFFTLPRLALGAAAVVTLTLATGALLNNSQSGSSHAPALAEIAPETVPEATLLDLAPEAADLTVEEFQEEVEMIDYMDGLLAVQDVEVLDDEDLANLLF
ncbi:MAG: hypothetical protein AAF591_23110 [Verrucomicrobiota bacterium]